MFTYKYETRYGDYKNYDEIKTGSVLDMVQDIAIRDSDFCGYGLDKLRSMNMAWLLQGINLEFLKPVRTHITVEAQTGVRRMKGATSERCSVLKQNGEMVGNRTRIKIVKNRKINYFNLTKKLIFAVFVKFIVVFQNMFLSVF